MRKKHNINSKIPLIFMRKFTRNYEAYIKNNEEMINNKILLPFLFNPYSQVLFNSKSLK